MAKYFNDASITSITALAGYRFSIYNSLGKLYYTSYENLAGVIQALALDALPDSMVSLDDVNIAADELPYGTGADTYGKTSLTAFARTILDDADAAAVRSTLGLVIGTNVQAYDAELAAIAGLTSASNKIIRFTGSGTADLLDYSTDSTMAGAADTLIYSGLAVKSYVDNLLTGLKWKAAVACASTANITLSGEQTIDGILTSGSRVLVKNQSTASQNGIYVSAAGAWARATDADAGAELVSGTVFVSAGTTNADTQWTCTNDSITIGSTNITFAQVSGAGTYSAGTGLQLSGNQFSISDVELLAIAGLTSAEDRLPYFTGSGTASLATFTSFGRSLVDDADASAARTTLGLGTMATQAASAVAITGGTIYCSGSTTITDSVGSGAIFKITDNSGNTLFFDADKISTTSANLFLGNTGGSYKNIYIGNGVLLNASGFLSINALAAASSDELVSVDSTGLLKKSGVLAGGSYTPTITNLVNLDSTPTINYARYCEIGGVVTVSFLAIIDPTASGVCEFQITLPSGTIASGGSDISGLCTSVTGSLDGYGKVTSGSTASKAGLLWVAPSGSSGNLHVMFQYKKA